jgi:hypothetical protein
VRELIPLPGQRRRLHSGYNLSLSEGAYQHGLSATATTLGTTTGGQYSDVSEHISYHPTLLLAHPSVDKISYLNYMAPTR